MFKKVIMPAMLAVAIVSSAGSAAFAAGTASPVAGTQQTAKLTKEQIKKIEADCKAMNKKDKKAYKTCVNDKKKTAEKL